MDSFDPRESSRIKRRDRLNHKKKHGMRIHDSARELEFIKRAKDAKRK